MKNKKIIIVLLVIILMLLAVIGVITYKLINDKKEENKKDDELSVATPTLEPSSKPQKVSKEKDRDLTKEELKEITDYISDGKTLFLATEYESAKDISLYFQIHYGFDYELTREIMEEEELENIGIDPEILEFTTISKITSNDMKEYIKNNLDIELDDLKIDNVVTYSSKYDIYYYYNPTDAYALDIDIKSGRINEDGQYVIKYSDQYGYNWIVTLEKDGERYIFVSNINSAKEKIDKIKEMKDLNTKEVNYNVNYDCKFHYKGSTLYYAELINTQSSGDLVGKTADYYYFENNKFLANISVGDPELYTDDLCSEKIYKLFVDSVKE